MRAVALLCKKITTSDDMLYTNLKHIETTTGYENAIGENENVLIVCGSMAMNSIQQYRIAEQLESLYPQVKFFDMEFNNPESKFLCDLFDNKITVPYLIYFRNGEMVYQTSGIQTREQMAEKLDKLLLIEVDSK
jgi:thioredoxin 1